MRAVIAGVLLSATVAAGCRDGGDTVADATPVDGWWAGGCDLFKCSPPCELVWWRVERAADGIASMDPAPVTTGRTFRAALTATMYDCEDLGMLVPRIDEDARTVHVPVAVFARSEAPCGYGVRVETRPIALVLPTAGTWTIYAGADASAPALTVEVAPAPERTCGTDGACELDCDCPEGERCLGGGGVDGTFTACARPCELDRDCGGAGWCGSLDDGLERTCQAGAECDAGRACPTGWSCEQGACVPPFMLGGEVRRACTCDGECSPWGLRCVVGDDGLGRCEATCPTDGPWCAGPGAHACGRAEDDLAGLATVDGVCGWLGE